MNSRLTNCAIWRRRNSGHCMKRMAGTRASPGSFLKDLNNLSDEGRSALSSLPIRKRKAKIDALAKDFRGDQGYSEARQHLEHGNASGHSGDAKRHSNGCRCRLWRWRSGRPSSFRGAWRRCAWRLGTCYRKIRVRHDFNASGSRASSPAPSTSVPLTTPMLTGAAYGALSPDARTYLMGQGQ